MNIINLTPHDINVYNDGELVETFKPSEDIARVSCKKICLFRKNNIGYYSASYGKLTGLPEKIDGFQYIVSRMVFEAARVSKRGTSDLLIPGEAVRDTDGKIIGCEGFFVQKRVDLQALLCYIAYMTNEIQEKLVYPNDIDMFDTVFCFYIDGDLKFSVCADNEDQAFELAYHANALGDENTKAFNYCYDNDIPYKEYAMELFEIRTFKTND